MGTLCFNHPKIIYKQFISLTLNKWKQCNCEQIEVFINVAVNNHNAPVGPSWMSLGGGG